MPARRAERPEERSFRSRLVEMEGLRIVRAGKGHDLVPSESVGPEICELADLAILKVKVRTQQARAAGDLPQGRVSLALALGRRSVLGHAQITAPGQLIGAPIGHRLALLVEELHERLADADVRSRNEVALFEHGVAAADNVAGAERYHPPSLVHAGGSQRCDAVEHVIGHQAHHEAAGVPARGTQPTDQCGLGCLLVDVQGLGIPGATETDDLVLEHGPAAALHRGADLEILMVQPVLNRNLVRLAVVAHASVLPGIALRVSYRLGPPLSATYACGPAPLGEQATAAGPATRVSCAPKRT